MAQIVHLVILYQISGAWKITLVIDTRTLLDSRIKWAIEASWKRQNFWGDTSFSEVTPRMIIIFVWASLFKNLETIILNLLEWFCAVYYFRK